MAETQPAELTLAYINRVADALADAGDGPLAARATSLILGGRPDLANALINRAFETRQDYSSANLIAFHVTLNALHIFADDPERHDALNLAHTLLDAQPKPRLVAIGGLSGSGKSTLARALAERLCPPLGAFWLRTDGIRKRLLGLPPEIRLGEEGYKPVISAKVYRRLAKTTQELLEKSQTVIAEATFTRRQSRNVMEKIAAKAQAPFTGIWLEAPLETMIARADSRAFSDNPNTEASDATGEIVARQVKDLRGEIRWHRLSTNRPFDEVLADALALLQPGGSP